LTSKYARPYAPTYRIAAQLKGDAKEVTLGSVALKATSASLAVSSLELLSSSIIISLS
jgi:hypothetical protein